MTPRVIAFKVEIDGVRFAVKNQEELSAAIKLTDEAFKKADFGSKKYAELEKTLTTLKDRQREIATAARDSSKEQQAAAQAAERAAKIASGSIEGQRLELKQLRAEYEALSEAGREANGPAILNRIARLNTSLTEYRQTIRDTAREQTIAADKAQGSYRALNAELVNLRRQYKELSAAERDGVAGRDTLRRIDQLDKELKDIDASMGQYQRNVGNYASAFADLGGIDFAALATPAGAIAAVGTAAIAAGAAIKELTDEYRVLRGEISTLTETTGQELDDITTRVLAISETFGEDTQEVLLAANAAARQLGISYDEALGFIEEGFIAGSNAQGEFLDNIQEYPVFFREAGLSADQFFAVANKSATSGIFSDKGLDAVKEAALSLRELPQAAQDALAGIGISSDQIREEIEENGVGAAIATVSRRLGELEATSPAVGTAIADIFKGAGEDAGLDYLLTLQDLGEATGSLIDETNAYQLEQQRTLEVNEEFARVQGEVTEALGGAGATVDNLLTQGQALLLRFVVPIIENARRMFDAFQPLITALVGLGRQVGLISDEGDLLTLVIDGISKASELAIKPLEATVFVISKLVEGYTAVVGAGQRFLRFIGVLGDGQDEAAESSRNMGRGNAEARRELAKMQEEQEKAAGGAERLTKEQRKANLEAERAALAANKQRDATKAAAVATDAFAKDSVAALRKELQALNRDLNESSPDEAANILADIIDVEAAIKEIEEGRRLIRDAIARSQETIEPISILASTSDEVTKVEETGEAVKAAAKKSRDELNEQIEENLNRQAERQRVQALEAEQTAAKIAEIQETIFGGFNDIVDQLTENSQARQEREIAAVERRYEAEIAAAEGNTERQEQLREELAQRTREIERQEFERQKRLRTAAALASLAEGVVNILSSPSVIPDPLGAAFKAVRIGILTATTAAQIANIQRQQLAARGLLVDRPSIPRPRQRGILANVMAGGGIVNGFARGQTHNGPNQGIDVVLNGRRVKIEDGEFVDRDEFGGLAVVNKRAAAEFRSTLADSYGHIFPGKRQMLSDINGYRGYGVRFANEGALIRPDRDGIERLSSGSVSVRATTLSRESVVAIAQAVGESVRRGSEAGVSTGLGKANRRAERESIVKQKTKT